MHITNIEFFSDNKIKLKIKDHLNNIEVVRFYEFNINSLSNFITSDCSYNNLQENLMLLEVAENKNAFVTTFKGSFNYRDFKMQKRDCNDINSDGTSDDSLMMLENGSNDESDELNMDIPNKNKGHNYKLNEALKHKVT